MKISKGLSGTGMWKTGRGDGEKWLQDTCMELGTLSFWVESKKGFREQVVMWNWE